MESDNSQNCGALFEATFEQAAIGIAHVALDGSWLRVNQKLCDIVGYSREELLQITFQDITYADDLDTDLGLVAKVLSGELETYTLEKRYIRKNGQIVWINLTVSLMRNEQGLPAYFISFVEDIQRRKNAERALENERAVFRDLTEIATDYFWELDEQFRFRQISPSIAERSGLNHQNFKGKARWELPYVGVPDGEWEKHKKTLEAHQPFREFVAAMRNMEGELRWFLISGHPIFSKNGVFKGFRGVSQDITDRKKNEERLRQHGLVFEFAQEGIVITDANGFIVDANPAFERITEYRLQDILGQRMSFLHSGRHSEDFYRDIWQTINATGQWQGEIWNRRKGGDIYCEWTSITVVYDEQRQVTNYLGISIDINRTNHVPSELEQLAHKDALTGLPNRLLLRSRLQHALDRAIRYGSAGAILFIDFDDFKKINDSYGHNAGDELLRQSASRMRQHIRNVDTLARLGGDEFVIVLDEMSDHAATGRVAQQVIDELSKPFSLNSNLEVRIGASVGVAFYPKDGLEIVEVFEAADQALYEAKALGKGKFRFYS